MSEYEYKKVIFICDECAKWLDGFGDEYTHPLKDKKHSNGFCMDERCAICEKFTSETYAITMKELIETIAYEEQRVGACIGGNSQAWG